MQKILTKREKIILYAAIGVIIFSLAFNFLIAPVFTKNDDLNKGINITRTKLRKYIRLLAQKEIIQNKFKKFSSTLRLPDQKDIAVSALSELENLANNANIRIIDIRPQPVKSLNLYKEIIIDLRAEGNMEGYLKFIYNVEHSLMSLTIKRLQLNAKPNAQVLEGSFSISQLSLPE